MSNEMTVADLREMLDDYGEDCKVRIVHQQHYPLQETLGGIYDPSQRGNECEECGYTAAAPLHDRQSEAFDHEMESGEDAGDGQTIYLVATGHPAEGSGYGSRDAWEQMERRR